MGNRMAVTAILIVCVVLGTGLWATARQVTGQSNIVDPSMEQAKDIYISASDETAMPEKPVILSHYGAGQATTIHPVLRWSRIDGAVMYDIQVMEKHVVDGMETETYDMIMPLKRAYTNACEVALPEDFTSDHFYWRVRGLALDGHVVSAYSDLEKTYVDHLKPVMEKPTLLSVYNQGRGQVLLYPVYDWIAVPEAASYELEIMDEAPENPNGIEPSKHRIEAYYPIYAEQYDAKSHVSANPFYWRVRALDADGNPLGVYSDAHSFVTDPSVSYAAAIFGDSISHGGGSVSYSPTDWDFSYGSYLDFPTINLSQSGDTSEMTAERFEKDVLPFHPKYLLILMGSNSIRAGVPASEVIADMEYVRKQCLEHGTKPVFLTMPPFNADNIKKAFDQSTVYGWSKQVRLINEYVRSQVHVDITENMEDENGDLRTELALDGLHLDPPGKRMMAEAINQAWPDITALPDSAWEE